MKIPSIDEFLGESSQGQTLVSGKATIPVRLDGRPVQAPCTVSVHTDARTFPGVYLTFLPKELDYLLSLRDDHRDLDAALKQAFGDGHKVVNHQRAGITYEMSEGLLARAFLDPLGATPI